jgi:chemotaxis protein CheD
MLSSSRINIVQGEYYVSAERGLLVTTLLGSCVAACLYDPRTRIGGINHFLLPGQLGADSCGLSERQGVHLMELLVNGLLKLGAGRDRLEAKLFGGGKTVSGLKDIGSANSAFAKAFLEREGIPIVASSLGGKAGRRIQFWPEEGRVLQHFMADRPLEVASTRPASLPDSGNLELF